MQHELSSEEECIGKDLQQWNGKLNAQMNEICNFVICLALTFISQNLHCSE